MNYPPYSFMKISIDTCTTVALIEIKHLSLRKNLRTKCFHHRLKTIILDNPQCVIQNWVKHNFNHRKHNIVTRWGSILQLQHQDYVSHVTSLNKSADKMICNTRRLICCARQASGFVIEFIIIIRRPSEVNTILRDCVKWGEKFNLCR